MKNFLHGLSYLILFLSLVFLTFIGFFLIQPFRPPLLTPNPIPILNKDHKIHPGEGISTELDYCIYSKTPSTTTRTYRQVGEDQRIYFLATTESIGSKPGCGHVISHTTPVPLDIPPGEYKIVLVSTFRVNPLKSVVVQYETEEFEIVQGVVGGGN